VSLLEWPTAKYPLGRAMWVATAPNRMVFTGQHVPLNIQDMSIEPLRSIDVIGGPCDNRAAGC
jgi:hypothetical protein